MHNAKMTHFFVLNCKTKKVPGWETKRESGTKVREEMFVIGILSENVVWGQTCAEWVSQTFGKAFGKTEIRIYENRNQLLEQAPGNSSVDVLFLDMDLRQKDGLEIARTINEDEKWQECLIIFCSDYMENALEVYSTDHIYFVLKPQLHTRLHEIMWQIIRRRQNKKGRLIFELIGKRKVVLLAKEILYFERVRRTTRIETVHGSYEIKDKLDELEKRLSDLGFIRCHNSYLVYFQAIRELHKNMFIMKNGAQVMISRSYAKEIQDGFDERINYPEGK